MPAHRALWLATELIRGEANEKGRPTSMKAATSSFSKQPLYRQRPAQTAGKPGSAHLVEVVEEDLKARAVVW